MRRTTTHPGVNLIQRAKGGVWNVRYFDVRSGKRTQVLKSTLTDDHAIATKIAENIHAFFKSPESWDTPPEGYHPRAYELLGLIVGDGEKTQALSRSLRILAAPARLAGVDPTPALQRAQNELNDLKKALKNAQQIANEWKRRAISAEALNARHSAKAVKARAILDGLTLEKVAESWVAKLSGDSDYTADQKFTVNAFVREFGEKSMLTEIAGRETDIDTWIRSIKSKYGKRKGQSIGAGRRQEIRRVVLKLLRDSGLDLDNKAIKRPSKKDVRNDRGAIRWLTRDQAKKVAGKIKDQYFADAFRVQLALGLRPNELLTLKKADFSELDGKMTLTLSPLEHLTLKEGSRTIFVPEHIQPIIKKRLKKNPILFPHHGSKHDGKPWSRPRFFDLRYVKALRAAGKAAGVAFELDGRVARRTCATLLLGAGVAPKAVADILGDNLQTVIEHYAAAIPGAADPSKAAIT